MYPYIISKKSLVGQKTCSATSILAYSPTGWLFSDKNKMVPLFFLSRTASILPLPERNDLERPRIDFVIFMVDLTSVER